jgi:DNA-binding LacI/PurR family transcriptional regulator
VHIFHETLLAVRTAGRTANRNLILAELPTESSCVSHLPDVLRELTVDGLLISCLDTAADAVFKWVKHYHIPAMWMNLKLPADCVYPDDFAGGREATERLLALGHTSVLYIDDTLNEHYSRIDRLAGYQFAMGNVGLNEHVLDIQSTTTQRICEVLKAANAPTAVIAYGWEVAVKVYCGALAIGLAIPRDLSIVTFHSSLVSFTDVPITTMVIPASRMGQQGFEQLLRKIDTPAVALEPMAIEFSYEAGGTMGPVPTK